MSTLGLNTHKTLITDWNHPDAPERFEGERRCANGVKCVVFTQIQEIGKVSILRQAPRPGSTRKPLHNQSASLLPLRRCRSR